MVSIETEFYNSNKFALIPPFPSLKYLGFSSMPAWQEWCSYETGAFPQLQELSLISCPKLVGYLPKHLPALTSLYIKDCQFKSFHLLSSFPNLEKLEIESCENVESLSRGLPALSMTYLRLLNCSKLKSLPLHMDKLLPNLKKLRVLGCLETEWHGEEDMPPHLTHLTIDHCIFAKFSRKWGLPNLIDLRINGYYDNGTVQCFPEQGLLLPSSLTTLSVQGLRTLDTLECNGFLHLTSLRHLSISECPKLERIVGERLPSSIKELHIGGCHLLEEQRRMKEAEIWPKISHIPTIRGWQFSCSSQQSSFRDHKCT